MKSRHKGTKKGFTLIELSFAIAFIAVLLITVTLITNEIISIYRKGYAIKNVNQVGRDLIDDIQNTITQSPPSDFSAYCNRYNNDVTSKKNCEDNKGGFSFYQQYYSQASIRYSDEDGDGEDDIKYIPTGGVFCTGKYSYIWNTGYLYNTDGTYKFSSTNDQNTLKVKISYNNGEERTTATDFRLLKIEDRSSTICGVTLAQYPDPKRPLKGPGSNDSPDMTIELPDDFKIVGGPEEMLTDNDASLALFDLVVFEPARVEKTNRLLFSGSFILATITGGVDIMTSSNFCKAPSNFAADFNYCAINKFNFTIQASGN